MIVTDVTFTPADASHRETGLLGWLRVTLADAVIIDGLALRRTLHGDLVLSWPRKANGRPVATPANASARRRIENAILAAISQQPMNAIPSAIDDAEASAERVRIRRV